MIHKELSDGMVDPIQWTSPSAVQRVRPPTPLRDPDQICKCMTFHQLKTLTFLKLIIEFYPLMHRML